MTRTPTKDKPEMIEVKIKTKHDKKDWELTRDWSNQPNLNLPVSVNVSDLLATISVSAWLSVEQHADIFYSDVEALAETNIASRLNKYVYNPKRIYNNPNGTDGNR